jgi:hypothetical protein
MHAKALLLAFLAIMHGHSMEPLFHEGTWVKIDPAVSYSDIHAGMPIAFNAYWTQDSEGRVVHIAVRKNFFGYWVTKGVNNPKDDPYCVTPDNYIGAAELVTFDPISK